MCIPKSFRNFAVRIMAKTIMRHITLIAGARPNFMKIAALIHAIQAALNCAGIHHMWFGEEFGARRTDAMDADNKVDFEKAVQTLAFLRGTERVLNGLQKGYRISLMCSEAHPLECHRFAMVSRWFYEHGVDMQHIVHDENGQTIAVPHKTLQDEMVAEYVRKKKIPQVQPPDMFGENECTKEQQIVLAYRQKNKEIAYQQEIEERY